MTYGTRSGQLPVPPPSVRTGEVYADEGTLIMDPASAYAPEPPPSYAYPPPPPSSVRPPASSGTDLRGNWVVPAPLSSRALPPKASRNDRGVLAAMGIGGLAVLAAFAAALLAFSDEAPGARGRGHQAAAASAPVEAPLAAASLPVEVAVTTSFAPPAVQAVTAAPVVELGDDLVPPTVSAPAPAPAPVRVVAPTPKSAPAVAAAPSPKPAVAAAPSPAPKKGATKTSGKSQQEILEDLLEQQLAR